MVWTMFVHHMDRYVFDFRHCKHEDGWRQFDTHQDASYFGIWIHDTRRTIVMYAEGDLTVTECADHEHFVTELEGLHAVYGAAPPAFMLFDEHGQRTEVYDERARTLPQGS
tara:strand:- start:211 stop:543 length:333 start_codon:yes stop_codon:yes gene_type:complete